MEKLEAQFRAFAISQVFLTSVITMREKSLCLHQRRTVLELHAGKTQAFPLLGTGVSPIQNNLIRILGWC